MDDLSKSVLTVSGVLFGFFFAAFWWLINRELTFDQDQRHFKPATGILLISMALLAVFGIILPLRRAVVASGVNVNSYRGVFLALIAVHGYMLIELGHYGIYQWPKYVTKSEIFFLSLTILLMLGLVITWWVLL
jgi:hypothetical protein